MNWTVRSLLLGMLACTGCKDYPAPANVSACRAADRALAEYDMNHDGYLDAAELERCPALKNALAKLDTDNDGRVSADEINKRLTFFKKSRVGLTAVPCRVLLNRVPLAGAVVRFEPEKFLGTEVKPAEGITNASGVAIPKTEGQQLQGMQCGYYRIIVSKKNDSGQEMIPARYNAESILGEEVAPDFRKGGIRLQLRSR
jgi:hypothetical protein